VCSIFEQAADCDKSLKSGYTSKANH